MKLLIIFSRIVIGLIFILSGYIKLIDPILFSYKLEEYFSPSVFDLPFLTDLSLPLAVFLALFECLLGFMLWLGVSKKITLINLFGLILFFSFLTFYSAYFNKVTDCGCFGETLPLTPWQSFGKDIVLLFFALPLILGRKYIRPILKKGIRTIFLLVILTTLSATAHRGIAHLPIIDFRSYAVGKNITEQIKTAEELGLEGSKHQILYTLKNTQDQSDKTVTGEEYINQKFWKNPHWQIQSEKTVQKKIKNGYEPPIQDFVLRKGEQDVTEEILNEPFALLVICHDFSKANPQGLEKLRIFIPQWQKLQPRLIGVSSSRISEQFGFSWLFADDTLLKTIIRSNPGLMLLRKGTVMKKWHWRDMPDSTKIQNLINQK